MADEHTGDCYNNPSYLCLNENFHNVLEKKESIQSDMIESCCSTLSLRNSEVVISCVKKEQDFRRVMYN